MTKKELEEFIREEYKIEPEMPFPGDCESEVFRHPDNQKWFALVMKIEKKKLGLFEEGCVDIVNVKAEPEIVAAVTQCRGIFPAYHMNKRHWLTILLDESVQRTMVENHIDMSYSLTQKIKK